MGAACRVKQIRTWVSNCREAVAALDIELRNILHDSEPRHCADQLSPLVPEES
jgi:hypothetical protein